MQLVSFFFFYFLLERVDLRRLCVWLQASAFFIISLGTIGSSLSMGFSAEGATGVFSEDKTS